MAEPAFNGGRVKQVRIEITFGIESARTFDHVKKQVVVQGAFGVTFAGKVQTVELDIAGIAIDVENDFDERRAARADRPLRCGRPG